MKSYGNTETTPALSSWVPSRRQLFLALGCYFAVQLVSRCLLSSSLHLDESEQVLLAQRWSWGYGPQPPLYTWIQRGVFDVFGVSVFSVALLKNSLLFATYVLCYECARKLSDHPAIGVAAAVSLLFLPQISWESQRDLTHSVLAAMVSLATLLAFARLKRVPSIRWYLILGCCIGFGCLAKYNYIFFPVGLVAAALSLKSWKGVVLNRGFLLTLAVACVVFLPNGLWMLQHLDLASRSSSKLRMEEQVNWLGPALLGIKSLFMAVVAFVSPLLGVYVIALWKRPRRDGNQSEADEARALLFRAMVLVIGMLAVLVLTFHVTSVRNRWLQPVMIATPVLVSCWLSRRLDPRSLKRLIGLAFVAAVVVATLIPARIVFGERLRRDEPLMRPYDVLARYVRDQVSAGDVIVGDSGVTAGNLRLHLAGHLAATPELARLFAPRPARVLLVWDATRATELPERLKEYAAEQGLRPLDPGGTVYASATFKYHRSRQARIGMLKVRNETIRE